MKPVELKSFLADTFKIYRTILSTHRIVAGPVPEISVIIDKLKIELVFFNLLSNAAKYSAHGSVISITTILQDGILKIGIKEQGAGLSPQNSSRIFEKFFREEETAGKYSGFGVGLYIVAQIIKEHKGEIWVESVPG